MINLIVGIIFVAPIAILIMVVLKRDSDDREERKRLFEPFVVGYDYGLKKETIKSDNRGENKMFVPKIGDWVMHGVFGIGICDGEKEHGLMPVFFIGSPSNFTYLVKRLCSPENLNKLVPKFDNLEDLFKKEKQPLSDIEFKFEVGEKVIYVDTDGSRKVFTIQCKHCLSNSDVCYNNKKFMIQAPDVYRFNDPEVIKAGDRVKLINDVDIGTCVLKKGTILKKFPEQFAIANPDYFLFTLNDTKKLGYSIEIMAKIYLKDVELILE